MQSQCGAGKGERVRLDMIYAIFMGFDIAICCPELIN